MAKYRTYGFEKMDVYKNALLFSAEIRKTIIDFPAHERYELTSQLIRASDSIRANLAEGSGRASNFDQAHFTNMAYASGLEVIDDLNLAHLMQYIGLDLYESLRIKLDLILSQLNSLYKFQINNDNTLKNKLKKE